MTEYEMMKKFIEENTDITLKYLMWQELILEPQVVNSDVNIEAEDTECETITINLDKDGNIA
jgi:hypothetical protein